MKTLLNSKYLKVDIDVKAWVLGIYLDWRSNDTVRPYFISVLCVHFEIGKDPL